MELAKVEFFKVKNNEVWVKEKNCYLRKLKKRELKQILRVKKFQERGEKLEEKMERMED